MQARGYVKVGGRCVRRLIHFTLRLHSIGAVDFCNECSNLCGAERCLETLGNLRMLYRIAIEFMQKPCRIVAKHTTVPVEGHVVTDTDKVT